MSEFQGRGPITSDEFIEKAAKRAKENGGSDTAIRDATQQICNTTESSIVALVRDKMKSLLT
jgi:hypothetical protein